jgi:D-sedoheptulose 7-phosphate isomerase
MEKKYFDNLYTRYPNLVCIKKQLTDAYNLFRFCYNQDGVIYIAGNGGSRADADHICGELMKGFIKKRPLSEETKAGFEKYPNGAALSDLLQEGIPAIPLGNMVLSSAINNDIGANIDFAQQLYVLGRAGDVLIAISTSGNSENIYNAALVAKARRISVVSLTGENGGRLRALSDVCISVPETETYKIQELHLPVYHAICAQLEDDLFD